MFSSLLERGAAACPSPTVRCCVADETAVATRTSSQWRLVGEIPDALRQNRVTLENETVLRLPLLGLWVAADDFFEQIERALTSAGYQRPRRSA